MKADLLRRQVLESRHRRSPDAVAEISLKVIRRFLEQAGEPRTRWSGRKVALYRALPGEFNLGALEEWLKGAGSRLYYPRVANRSGTKQLEFAEIPADADSGSAWQKGPFGIQEPHSTFVPVDPASLEVIFMPGVAFGLEGERVGMGAGYYDFFVPKATSAVRVALTFDDQLFPRIEQNPWDQPVHWVLTECREAIPAREAARIRKWFFDS